jgi:outer membrane biosynthesis protein TonB
MVTTILPARAGESWCTSLPRVPIRIVALAVSMIRPCGIARAFLFTRDALYDLDAMDTATHHELRTWYKYAKSRKSLDSQCGFESAILEPYIRHAVIDRLETLAPDGDLSVAVIDLFEDDTLKTVASYRRQALSILNNLWRGSLSFASAVGEMTALIEQQFRQAFIRGIAKNSLTFNDLEASEQAELDSLILEEKTHVLDLIGDIYKAREDGNIQTFRNRIELWVARYDRVEDRAFVIAARKARLMWVRNPRKESCDDCLILDGIVKLAVDWKEANIEPRSPRLKCFGAFCGCGFKIASADTPLSKGAIPFSGKKKFLNQKVAWSDSDHPRDESGQFTSGGGGSSGGGSSSDKPDKPEKKPKPKKPKKPSSDKPKTPKKPKPKPKPASDTPAAIQEGKPDWASKPDRLLSMDDGHYDFGHIKENPTNVMAGMREKEMSRTHVRNLDSSQQTAIQDYSGEDYREINNGLRGKGDLSENHQETVNQLDSAIRDNTLPQPTVLYRGMKMNDDLAARMQPGTTFTDNAYTSTSFDQRISEDFSGSTGSAVMRIKAPAGQNGVAMSAISDYPTESEFLLPRGTRYQINSVHRQDGKYYIDAEIVSDD